MAGCAAYGVHQARAGIHTDMRFHAKVPRVALLAQMHLAVTRFVFVFGRGWGGNQGGVYGDACLEQQAALSQAFVDMLQDFFGQLVRLQSVVKPQLVRPSWAQCLRLRH